MKKITANLKLANLLSLALLCFGVNFVTAAAQETGRERVIAKPTQTPANTPKPKNTPTATPTPQITPLPTATPVPSPAATPVPLQTLSDLQARIRQSLARPELRRGQVGVKIVSLDTGRTIFDENSDKYFMPASNMKSYTVAAALARLSPNFRFVTSVYAGSMPDADGVVRGDLTVYGRGDPSISYAFNDGDYSRGMDALVQKIVAAGVKRIEGNLIGDESYFNTESFPATWEWDDLQWYYGAEVSALTVNDNAVNLVVRPGAGAGSTAFAVLQPGSSGLMLINRVTTSAAGSKREGSVYRRLGSNNLEISGTIPLDQEKYETFVAVPRPANAFVSLLRQLLAQRGIIVTGQTRVVSARDKAPAALAASAAPLEIARLESVPLSIIAAKTMKPSQNLYTELILRALGEQMGNKSNPKTTSEERGIEVVQAFLTEAGIAPGSVVQYDGSGLSRHDLITPASAVQLYEFMNRHAYSTVWHDSMTFGGVDGTLQNRFRRTPAENNVHGKTGTIDQVSALSGYVTTASRERLVFSILTNAVPQGRARTDTIDEIVVALASFNGKSN